MVTLTDLARQKFLEFVKADGDIVLGLRHIHGTGVDAFNIFEILRSPKSTFL